MGELLLAFIACVMFILVARELARTYGPRRQRNVRVVVDPEGDEWLTLDQVAAHLESTTAQILNLVERDAIPFYVDAVKPQTQPDAYRFKRKEIDDWVIG